MPSRPNVQDIHMLVVEPSPEAESNAIQALNAVNIRGTRSIVSDTNAALSKIANEDFQVCVLSENIPVDEQLAFLGECAKLTRNVIPANVSLILKEDQDSLIALMQAGAHAVELMPCSENRIEKAILRASYKLLETARGQGENQEQVTNISWLLERVASRLEQLADNIESTEGLEALMKSQPKLVKEALLSAIGSSGADDEQFSEDFLAWLQEKAKQR